MHKKSVYNILLFFVIVIISAWLGVLVDKFSPEQKHDETLGMGIWLSILLIIVLILRIFAGDGWKEGVFRLNLKSCAIWYNVSSISFYMLSCIVLIIGKLLGWIDLSNFDVSDFTPIFFNLLIINLIKKIFEESVWRGYLTSKLIKLDVKDITIYLKVGLVWSLWHLPYYIEFLSESTIASGLPISRVLFLFIASVNMIIWTIVYVEIYRLINYIWSVVLLHSVEDSLINPLFIDNYIKKGERKVLRISPILGTLAANLYLSFGIWLRKPRINIQMVTLR